MVNRSFAAKTARKMQPRIVVLETGVVYPVGDGEFVIGRDEKADLSLPDPLRASETIDQFCLSGVFE